LRPALGSLALSPRRLAASPRFPITIDYSAAAVGPLVWFVSDGQSFTKKFFKTRQDLSKTSWTGPAANQQCHFRANHVFKINEIRRMMPDNRHTLFWPIRPDDPISEEMVLRFLNNPTASDVDLGG